MMYKERSTDRIANDLVLCIWRLYLGRGRPEMMGFARKLREYWGE